LQERQPAAHAPRENRGMGTQIRHGLRTVSGDIGRGGRVPGLLLIAALVAGVAAADTLTDDALVAYASRPYDRAAKMLHRDTLGIHHGVEVIAEFPCSDVCPNYTVRIIHYAVAPGPDCDKIGGVTRMLTVPVSIAVMRRPFCVPAVLVEKKLQ
jgi:hypothetical protein